jgi:hypothetical protein
MPSGTARSVAVFRVVVDLAVVRFAAARFAGGFAAVFAAGRRVVAMSDLPPRAVVWKK